MIDAVRDFLTIALQGDAPDLPRLALALDTLALAYHTTAPGKPSDHEDEPPSRDYDAVRKLLEARFPDFGFYAVADPSEPVAEEALVGDAIDDLADIIGDLQDVTWRWEHLGPEDADWNFRFAYETHWGRHLHDLRSYLHAKQFAS